MATYFFDLQDGDRVVVDNEGSDLSCFENARDEAAGFILQVAKDALPFSRDRRFTVTVRDRNRVPLCCATVMFQEGAPDSWSAGN